MLLTVKQIRQSASAVLCPIDVGQYAVIDEE